MTRPRLRGASASRVTLVLLSLVSLLLVATVALGIAAYRLSIAEPRLQDLSADQRRQLVEQAERTAPPVYQMFPAAGAPGFYHLKPNTRYDRNHPAAGPTGVLGDEFTTNDLGFRTIPTPKSPGARRIVVVGDSWTYGPGVSQEETFSHQLELLLTQHGDDGVAWETYNLAMMGWNTENQIAALRVLLGKLRPDLVVICPTSNDIDASFDVWKGRLINTGFRSAAMFRHSYEFERRWVEVFRHLQDESESLATQGIPTLIYFLAEWRKLAPYYAKLAGLTTPYTVVPTAYIETLYRLPFERDSGRHANEAGHRAMAVYLYNALVEQGLVGERGPLPSPYPVTFPGMQFDPAEVEAEFAMWRQHARNPDLVALDKEHLSRLGIFSLPVFAEARTVAVDVELLDIPGLYPLRLEVELMSPESVREVRIFERFAPGVERIELAKPSSLDGYDSLEIALHLDRAVSPPWALSAVSLKRPRIEVY